VTESEKIISHLHAPRSSFNGNYFLFELQRLKRKKIISHGMFICTGLPQAQIMFLAKKELTGELFCVKIAGKIRG